MLTNFEQRVKDEFEKHGWTVYTSGWPDMLCVKGNKVQAVEVKTPALGFHGNQVEVLNILAKFMQVRTAHPGPGYGDQFNSADMHLLVVDPEYPERTQLHTSTR